MEMLHVERPVDLVRVADLDEKHLSTETARVVALLLFREDKISLGRAAELSGNAIEAFIQFAGRHGVSLHYGVGGVRPHAAHLFCLNCFFARSYASVFSSSLKRLVSL